MKIQFKIILLVLIFFWANALTAQIKNIGLPFITNFNKEQYKAEAQNWDITQDEKGIMYFANSQGLLSFNGSEWQVYALPNNSIVRSVAYSNGRIYAGGFNEFGYFERDEFGRLSYNSLSSKLPENKQSFDEIWNIHIIDGYIILQSYLNVFIIENDEITILEPKSRFGFSYKVDNSIYIIDREYGLYKIEDNRLISVYNEEKFFITNEIPFIYRLNGRLLIGTTHLGIFELKNKKLIPWENEINKYFIKNQIYSGVKLPDNHLAIGTIQNGIYIINDQGIVAQQVNRLKGLQNNTVLSVFYDNTNNIWLGLDNGIDLLEINSPFTIFNYSSNIESTYASIVFNDVLYVGTNQGLFAAPIKELSNQFMYKSNFKLINGTMGQVWCLKAIDNTLFCGHNLGTFIVEDFKATLISTIQGGWDYVQVPWSKNHIIGGNYSGLHVFEKNLIANKWKSKQQVNGYIESSKKLTFDNSRNLWVTHELKGMFRINLSDNLISIKDFELYNNNQGLPEKPFSITFMNDNLYVTAQEKIFIYEESTNTFWLKNELIQELNEVLELTNFIEDERKDLWYFTGKSFGVFRRLEDGSYFKITKPFKRLSNIIPRTSYENISSIKNTEALIGSQEGLIHYQSDINKDYNKTYYTHISNVKSRLKSGKNEQDSLKIEKNIELDSKKRTIPYKYNSLSFKFYTSYFEAPNQVQHSFRLVGFDNNWSEWSTATYKEYTNLLEGDYIFEVKAKNIYENESEIAQFHFEVNPPFFRSTMAYAIYISIVLFIAVVVFIYVRVKIAKTRAIEEEKLIIKEEEFKKEVEISEQKIEKLEQEKYNSEMRLKNIELANTTMNLVQKNKLLTKVKNDLMEVSDKARSTAVKLDIKQLIIKIEKDINNDQNLKVFDKYFDQVHQDFVKRIKEKHPVLTPKDLRLCAYLRMNISTKEIAPLMNVSIRGLEISRYRLRKKLELEHEVNLVDYIMKV